MMKTAQKTLFFFFLLEGVCCRDWNISLPDNIDALNGSCVTINCIFDIPELYDIHLTDTAGGVWYSTLNSIKILMFNSSKPTPSLLKGNITGKLKDKDCTTIFYNVTFNHRGLYNFRIEGRNTLKYAFSQKLASVNVVGSPPSPTVKMFMGQMEVQEVLEGSTVNLCCSSKTLCSSSPPTLTWSSTDRLFLNDNSRPQQQQQTETEIISNLNFTATHLQHGVTYSCNITYQLHNRNTTAQNNITLYVLYAPKNTSVSVFPSNSVLEGTSVTLKCRSDANPAVLNYTWYRENRGQLEQIQSGLNLTFNTINRTHTGHYYCLATNQHGTQNASVFLDFQYAPKNTSVSVFPSNSVLEGTSVTLKCRSDANPAVLNYTWYRENRGQLEQIHTGLNLTFHVTDRTHTGRYYCLATNQQGSQNASVFLDIQYPPNNASISVTPSTTVLEGNPVTLFCNAKANPPPVNYTWYRKSRGQFQLLKTGFNLTFYVTNSTHSGWYYCVAQNKHGQQNTSVLLDIQFPPKNTFISVTPSSNVLEGNPVTLICNANANPAMINYTWYRKNGGDFLLLQTGYNLTFSVTTSTQSGLYYCVTQNKHGQQNSSVSLDIQYPPEDTSITWIPSSAVLEGNPVTLICISDANPAPVNYTWYRENKGHLEQILTGVNLTISVTSTTHTGLYLCVAQNKHGQGNSSGLLDIQYPPKNTSISVIPSSTVFESNPVTLICNASANPSPVNFTWYRENGGHFQLIKSGFILTFHQTNPTHFGWYYCVSQNKHGQQNSSVLLDIQFAPKNTSISVSPSSTVLEGNPVSLISNANANPAFINYTWYRENGGQLQQIQTGNNLTLSVTNRVHSGWYYCVAQNKHGQQNTSVSLDIQYSSEVSSSTCDKTQQTVCVCEVNGNPSSKVEWFLSGRPLSNSTNIFIREERLSQTNMKSYITLLQSLALNDILQCLSTNTRGAASTKFQFVLSAQETASTGSNSSSVLIGFVIGVLLMMVLLVIKYFCNRNRSSSISRVEDVTGFNLTNRAAQQDVVAPVNDAPVSTSGATAQNSPQSCNYSSNDFTNSRPIEMQDASLFIADYGIGQHY